MDALSVDRQTADLTFRKKDNCTLFYVVNRNGPLGSTPTVMTGYCDMPINGSKKSNLRGIVPFKGRNGSDFSKLKLALTDSTAKDVLEMCRRALSAWRDQYSPVIKSHWYQDLFGFADGTQVHLGTAGIENPEFYRTVEFSGASTFEAPSRTFYNAIYGDREDAPWYVSLDIPNAKETDWKYETLSSSYLVLRGEDGKPIKAKLGDGGLSIPSAGVPLLDVDTLNKVCQSKWFQESRWKCKTSLQLQSIEWRTNTDASSKKLVVYPVFKLRIYGSILMKRFPYVLPEGVVPKDQRLQVLNSALFDDVEQPAAKKRKRSTVKPKPKSQEIQFTQEILPESDIEGEEEMTSE